MKKLLKQLSSWVAKKLSLQTVNNHSTARKTAFTLAEVLITLAIIGVVAALTIPTLMANITQRQYDTAATTFERKLGEALKIMNTEMTLSGHTTTESFVNELEKHIKIINKCHSNELEKCMPKEATWNILDLDNGGSETSTVPLSTYTTAKQLGGDDYGTDVMGLQFANGVSALIAVNPNASQDPYSNQIVNITGSVTKNNGHVSLGTDAISMIYDVNGNGKPNTAMKDLRGINSKFNKTALFKLNGKYWGESFATQGITYSECERIKGSLGVTYCAETYQKPEEKRDDDHWLYAVKTCGGVSKLPTMEDLVKLAHYLYDTDPIDKDKISGAYVDYRSDADTDSNHASWTEVKGMKFDTTKNAAIGFPAPSFSVWSGRENSASTASNRHFSAVASPYDNSSNARYYSYFRGVCVGE